ncbi:MAG: hypothetical protein ACKVPX_00665 [Myxococcaceae bacterium]
MRALFEALNQELQGEAIKGEIYVLGGAVMCLVFNARASTQDVDALFLPPGPLRKAAKRIATRHNVPDDWLNDAAKGYLSTRGHFVPFLELSHLVVSTAAPEYLLAMKCLAMRLGAEFHDEGDVRFLLRYLGLETYADAIEVITRFYPLERFPQKTLHALEEILGGLKR